MEIINPLLEIGECLSQAATGTRNGSPLPVTNMSGPGAGGNVNVVVTVDNQAAPGNPFSFPPIQVKFSGGAGGAASTIAMINTDTFDPISNSLAAPRAVR